MSPQASEIKQQIRQRFASVARSPQSERVFPVGPDSAKALGYDAHEIDALPRAVTESFSGVGNPLSLGTLARGQTVLDLGCGAGLDSILAARRVGPTGTVIGIDMTSEMLDKARRNAASADGTNIEFHLAEADHLPVDDATVDVVVTNGVFNLCLDKPRVLLDLHRVMRPGGRLQMADILLHDDVAQEEVADKGTWSDWILGAVKERSLLEMLNNAGFVDARFAGWTGYHTSPFTEGAMIVARKVDVLNTAPTVYHRSNWRRIDRWERAPA